MKRFVVAVMAVLFLAVLSYAEDAAGAGNTGSQVTRGGIQKPAPKKGKVGKRQAKQLKRINHGVKSGALTKGETKKLGNDQKMIQEQKKDMKDDNNGKLSSEDKETLNKEQNQESKKIYDLKHNDATR